VTAVYLGVALIGFLAFLTWEPKVKALVSFVLMMQFFDAAPNLLFGMYVWDYGAILMLITAIELFFRTPVQEPVKHGYLVALRIFLAWMTVCFLWSLLVYRYDVVHTIKNARYMVLGYFMTLVFIRLFAVQPGSFEFLMKWIYRLTFVLMPVVVLQFLARKQLLFGLVSEYEGALVLPSQLLDHRHEASLFGKARRPRVRLCKSRSCDGGADVYPRDLHRGRVHRGAAGMDDVLE
jgi:hypothetical protein